MDNFYTKQLKNNAQQLYFWLLSGNKVLKGEQMLKEYENAAMIMCFPIVEKYRSKFMPTILGDHRLTIPMGNARKNYFTSAIKHIAKLPRVQHVLYHKAQDGTDTDSLEIFFTQGE